MYIRSAGTIGHLDYLFLYSNYLLCIQFKLYFSTFEVANDVVIFNFFGISIYNNVYNRRLYYNNIL